MKEDLNTCPNCGEEFIAMPSMPSNSSIAYHTLYYIISAPIIGYISLGIMLECACFVIGCSVCTAEEERIAEQHRNIYIPLLIILWLFLPKIIKKLKKLFSNKPSKYYNKKEDD